MLDKDVLLKGVIIAGETGLRERGLQRIVIRLLSLVVQILAKTFFFNLCIIINGIGKDEYFRTEKTGEVAV